MTSLAEATMELSVAVQLNVSKSLRFLGKQQTAKLRESEKPQHKHPQVSSGSPLFCELRIQGLSRTFL